MISKNGLLLVWFVGWGTVLAQSALETRGLLVRKYRDGEELSYRMVGREDGMQYEVRATGVVKRTSAGQYVEEYAWSNLVIDGRPTPLPAASAKFRQILSLDPALTPAIPNLAQVPSLIGPITDMLTFYSDLWLTIREAGLHKPGDHFFQKGNMAASWADGTYVTLGESAVDFDIALTGIDDSNQVATLLVRHIPPKESLVKTPASWMRVPVGETENNWVSVRRNGDRWIAAIGKETFDVKMTIRLADGVILSGVLDNVVETRERDCRDAELSACGEARSGRITRQIQISLDR